MLQSSVVRFAKVQSRNNALDNQGCCSVQPTTEASSVVDGSIECLPKSPARRGVRKWRRHPAIANETVCCFTPVVRDWGFAP